MLQQALSRGYRGMPAEALIAGSVDEVAEQFRAFGKIGYTDILGAPSDQRSAESPGLAGAAGAGARGAGPKPSGQRDKAVSHPDHARAPISEGIGNGAPS